jgi:trehalose utilization protein
MGTTCDLHATGMSTERVYCTLPGHPIAKGIPEYFELKDEEVYTEFFDIPQPDELVFIGGFGDSSVFRAGCAFYRSKGKIFYFQPGHETFPIYKTPIIQKIIINAIRWAAPIK